jgi:nitric oxide reductase NorQ protein
MGVPRPTADRLVKFAGMTRNLKGSGLDEGASTRLLVHAGTLISAGLDPAAACRAAVSQALTDDEEMVSAVQELFSSVF